jgi:hypothetical protein
MASLNLHEPVFKGLNQFLNAGNRGCIFRNSPAQIALLIGFCACHPLPILSNKPSNIILKLQSEFA